MIDLTDRAITHIMKNLRTEGEYVRVGLKPAGCTGFEYIIDWEKDFSTRLGLDPIIYDLVSLSDTSSLLVYAYGAPTGSGLSSYRDLYGILINPDTGDLLGEIDRTIVMNSMKSAS